MTCTLSLSDGRRIKFGIDSKDKLDLIFSFASMLKKNDEVVIYLYDPDSTNFSRYEFDFSLTQRNPTAEIWLFNNLCWGVQNSPKLKGPFSGMFAELHTTLQRLKRY